MTNTTLYSIDELVPHSGQMSLLSRVTDYGDGWLKAEVDIHSNSVFAEHSGVPAWIGIEYLAQAIAAYSGIHQRIQQSAPKLGFLLGTRRYDVNTEWFPIDQILQVRVDREMEAENGLCVFNGILTADAIEATAKINIYQPDDSIQFMKETHA